MIHILLFTLSMTLAHGDPRVDPYKHVRVLCRDLLYVGSAARDAWSRKSDEEKLKHWRQDTERYLKSGGRMAILKLMYEARFARIFERQLRARGLFKGTLESSYAPGIALLEVDRDRLIEAHPHLSAWLPSDYHLVLDPEAQVRTRSDAFLYAGQDENVIGLPLSLAYGELTDEDLITLQGVAGHVQRRRDRIEKGDYTLSLIIESDRDVPAVLNQPSKPIVEAEEILTGTLTSVEYLKRYCENTGDFRSAEKATQYLNLTWRELEAYRLSILPRIERALRQGADLKFDQDGNWIVDSLRVTFMQPRPAWDLARARRWLKDEKARVDRIHRVFGRLWGHFALETQLGTVIIPNAAICAETSRLQALLGTLSPLAR